MLDCDCHDLIDADVDPDNLHCTELYTCIFVEELLCISDCKFLSLDFFQSPILGFYRRLIYPTLHDWGNLNHNNLHLSQHVL